MEPRHFWQQNIEQSWKKHNVLWLAGVRRVGKTTLCKSLEKIEYFDCERPRVRRMLEDPEGFLEGLSGKTVVLDEIHRLHNPSEVLKLAADHYKQTQILATGSSTLAATTKFKDALTDRKSYLWLTPAISEDLANFGSVKLEKRFIQGGLPGFLLSSSVDEKDFQDWLDSYWAKDIQELFRLERRGSFLRFVELVLTQSGGIFEATRFAQRCEVSRPTIMNYLNVLETTFVAHVIRPFSTHQVSEIISAPKVYGFDTGFVCVYRGWDSLRPTDYGAMWEHYVLNELHAHLQTRRVRYWKDKRGHEVDFVLVRRSRSSEGPIAIECKWSATEFDSTNLQAFRRTYPAGKNFLVAHDVDRAHKQHAHGLEIQVVGLSYLVRTLSGFTPALPHS